MFPGQCKTSNKTYFFNITNNWEKYEVRMNEMVKDIKMWFLQNESECLPSSVLNSTGECCHNTVRVQVHNCYPSWKHCCQSLWRHRCWWYFGFWTFCQSTQSKYRTNTRLKLYTNQTIWMESVCNEFLRNSRYNHRLF